MRIYGPWSRIARTLHQSSAKSNQLLDAELLGRSERAVLTGSHLDAIMRNLVAIEFVVDEIDIAAHGCFCGEDDGG